jgi:S-adenosylmethionine synthetase
MSAREVQIDAISQAALGRQENEYVERKGLGHPDSICDAVMESISVALSRAYLEIAGRVLHHNLDKGLLVAGQSTPKLGGGSIKAPMRLVIGDRATEQFGERRIPVAEIVETTARQWFQQNLRCVDSRAHLVLQNELQPGSAELVGIFETQPAGTSGIYTANDTSAAVGYAPLTETERLVLAAEHFLNSHDFKQQFPETGEDVKVMAVRRARTLHLTVAMAFVDRHLWEEATYFHRKAAAQHALTEYLETKLHDLDRVETALNTLDQPGRGLDGMYLTVLGTSAESADGGQVGRGNRVNGLISLCRPMTLEAAAGKNPVSHVGKIYNVLSHHIANTIYHSVEGVEEVYVWLVSQIGQPLDEPWFASARLALAPAVTLAEARPKVSEIIQNEIAGAAAFTTRLVRGELPMC